MQTSAFTIIILVCVLVINWSVEKQSDVFDVIVKVHYDNIVELIDDRFVGVTIGTSLIADGWGKFDFKSEKLLSLASGLSPCFLRLGGTAADRLTFDPSIHKPGNYPLHDDDDDDDDDFVQTPKNFTMSARDWDLINMFTAEVGWDLIFDFNVLVRKEGSWDPTNAVELLKYTSVKGYNLSGFELGNEPNSFHHVFNETVTPQDLATDFTTLQNILRMKFPQFKSSLVIGPDTTQMKRKQAREYFEQFLQSEMSRKVDAATWHHYYVNGRIATLDDFINPQILDGLKNEIITSIKITQYVAKGTPVWLGETSSAYGGGAKGLSNVYVAGFMWLDKLGLSAKFGLKRVFRQSFYKGLYSLIDFKTLNPNPDYWLTLLYKRLVGNAVFTTTSTDQSDSFRVYAHCTKSRNEWSYLPGSLTLYVLNLYSHSVNMTLPQFPRQQLHLFLLTPADDKLTSHKVRLNGRRLELTADETLPPLEPKKIYDNAIFPAYSFGFIVIPDSELTSCKT